MSSVALAASRPHCRCPHPLPSRRPITPPSKPLNRLAFFARASCAIRCWSCRRPSTSRTSCRIGGSIADRVGDAARSHQGRAARPARQLPQDRANPHPRSPARQGHPHQRGRRTGSGSARRPRRCSGTSELMTFVPAFVRATQRSHRPVAAAAVGLDARDRARHDRASRSTSSPQRCCRSADATIGPAIEALRPAFPEGRRAGRCSMPSPTRRNGCRGRGAAAQRQAIRLLRSSVAAMLRERDAAAPAARRPDASADARRAIPRPAGR